MSWLEENYEKATLGAGAVILLAAGGLGYLKFSSAGEGLNDYVASAPKVQDLPKIESIQGIFRSLEKGHTASPKAVDTQVYTMFVGPSLWLKKGGDPSPLLGGTPVHPPIPNKWFLDNDMAEVIRKSDAKDADTDGDGFTNLEEFEGETDPQDPSSHPPLINKLKLANTSVQKMYLRLVIPREGQTGVEALKGRGTDWKVEGIKEGNTFGPPDTPERFELTQVAQQEVQRGNMTVSDWRADFIDTSKPGKPEIQVFRRDRFVEVADYTVEFQLLAGPNKGEKFSVPEGGTFTLPPGADGDPEFMLLSVDAENQTATLKSLTGDGQDIVITK